MVKIAGWAVAFWVSMLAEAAVVVVAWAAGACVTSAAAGLAHRKAAAAAPATLNVLNIKQFFFCAVEPDQAGARCAL
jgi:hypothetical protein